MANQEVDGNVLSDELIERLVRFPQTLALDLRARLEESIASNPEALLIARFYRDCYAQFDRLGARSPNRLEQFIANLVPSPNVTPVHMLASLHEQGFALSGSSIVPTMRSNGSRDLLEPMALLGARETSTMVGLLRHHHQHENWRVFVLTADLLRRANIVVSFPDVGVDVLVDASGCADFTLPDEDVKIEQLYSAIVRRPVVEIGVSPEAIHTSLGDTVPGGVVLPSGHFVGLEEKFDGWAVSLDASDSESPYEYRRIVCMDDEGTIELRRIVPEGKPILVTIESMRFSVRLYA